MQDQGKRLLLAVALALGVFFVWTSFQPKEEPAKTTAGSAQSPAKPAGPTVGPPAGAVNPAAEASAPGAATIAAPVEEAPRPPAVPLTLAFDNVVATFSSYCGGLTSWRLIDKRYDRDATKGYLLPEKSLMTVRDAAGKPVAPPADQLARLPDCGAFEVNFASSTSKFFVPRHAVWQGKQISRTEVEYVYSSPQITVEKRFTVVPETYLVKLVVRVTPHGGDAGEVRQQLSVTSYGFQDPAGVTDGSSRIAARVWSSSTMRDGSVVETGVDGVLEWPRFEPAIQWTGFEHPYLLVGFAPHVAAGERVEKHTRASKGEEGPSGLMRTDILFPVAAIKPGATATHELVGYLGPKNYDNLEQADAVAGFTTGFSTVVDLGWFGFIGRPLLWMLQKFHDVIGNWGISIILLTFLVKGLTLYWTTRSMRSMKAMAALAPQMKALQAKYGDDKQRQNAETMALYKQHNVNPVAGCLPILLQMPIWLALYRMLSSAGELYQQPFIPGWINDLTATDPFYVLPGLLVVTMFMQARLQPAAVDSTQQKFMQYGMPIMFGVFSFVCPAGLTVYMFTNTVLSALHSIYMNKFDKKSLAIAAQIKSDAAMAAPGAAGSAKPSKSGSPGKAKPAVKPVIDAMATEVSSSGAADTDDDTDDPDDAEASSAGAGAPGAGPARNRPRRKKRRR
jgi:YidC/Oxa1 family membrane protein insertase